MADKISKAQRSWVMSRIRKRDNARTELALASLLRKSGITGWRRQVRLPGTPDFALRDQQLAIFVDGCFWHGCKKCALKRPSTNRGYWTAKFERNASRDRRVNRALRQDGWRVLRIWEHEVQKTPERCIEKVWKVIGLHA